MKLPRLAASPSTAQLGDGAAAFVRELGPEADKVLCERRTMAHGGGGFEQIGRRFVGENRGRVDFGQTVPELWTLGR